MPSGQNNDLFFSIIQFTQDMKTNKPKIKTEKNKTQHSALTMNGVHDIKILEYWICIYSLVEGVFKKFFLESKVLPSINRYPIYKEKICWKKTKIEHNFHWLKVN